MTDAPKKKKSPQSDARDDDNKSRTALWAAAGVGVGSAAVVAALLYANRSRLPSWSGDSSDEDSETGSGAKAKRGPISHTDPQTD